MTDPADSTDRSKQMEATQPVEEERVGEVNMGEGEEREHLMPRVAMYIERVL